MLKLLVFGYINNNWPFTQIPTTSGVLERIFELPICAKRRDLHTNRYSKRSIYCSLFVVLRFDGALWQADLVQLSDTIRNTILLYSNMQKLLIYLICAATWIFLIATSIFATLASRTHVLNIALLGIMGSGAACCSGISATAADAFPSCYR